MSFLRNVFQNVINFVSPRVPLRALEPVHPPVLHQGYTFRERYMKYYVRWNVKVYGEVLSVDVHTIVRGDGATGLCNFLGALLQEGNLLGCKRLTVEFHECGPAMMRSIAKHHGVFGFDCHYLDKQGNQTEEESTGTGVNCILEKKINPNEKWMGIALIDYKDAAQIAEQKARE